MMGQYGLRMRTRKQTRAREIALQALYQFDLARKAGHGDQSVADFEPFVAANTQDPQVARSARWLIQAVLARVEDLDSRIRQTAKNWALGRIAPVDRCILRIALVELLERKEVPPKVAIDEAIELAKRFSTEQSGAFVNGILDRIYQGLARGESSEFRQSRTLNSEL